MSNFLSQFTADKSQTKLIVIAASTALALGSIFVAYFASSKLSLEDQNLLPALTEDETKRILTEIVNKTQFTSPKLIQAAEGIRQQIAAQGQEIDNQQLMKQFILPHFETMLTKIQNDAFDQYNVDEDEMEEAVNYYIRHGDKELASLKTKIKNIYKGFGGDVDDQEEEFEDETVSEFKKDITYNELIAIVKLISKVVIAKTEEFLDEYIQTHGQPQSQEQLEQFQLSFMMLNEKAEQDALHDMKISKKTFQKEIEANQDRKEIREMFMKLQMDTHRVMSAHGIGIAE